MKQTILGWCAGSALVLVQVGEEPHALTPVQDGLEAPADVAAPPEDAQRTESGIAYRVLRAGTGTERPGPHDHVEVHYSGWTTDGSLFDSSVRRGVPAKFPLSGVISGWTEGLQLMVVGEKTRFWIPEELAYKGAPGRPAGMLVFDVELLSFEAGVAPPEAPADCASPPESAVTTESGLTCRSLKAGTGARPKPGDTVRVHFSFWTSDGQLLQSTKVPANPGQPAEPMVMSLQNVNIPGFVEGIRRMSVGETMRLWVPEELAFRGQPGAPKGTIVFDVELLGVLAPPPAPDSVAQPPAHALKTESGLRYEVLRPAEDADAPRPASTSTVTVHYSGWTTDGKCFDSSVPRDEPATFRLSGVIPGWSEGLQLMQLGEKTRFWIPQKLAYKGMPGKPRGMLVFDVELLQIR